MNNMLIVIPYCKADAERAEALIDWVFHLNGRRQEMHALIAAAPDVHNENITRMKISAENAFESFDSIKVQKPGTNGLFAGVSRYLAKNYRIPFFWMEPDFTPIKPQWFREIAGFYYAQPKRYTGSFMQHQGNLYTPRCICYPADCHYELEPFFESNVPFNRGASKIIIPAATKNNLVKEIVIDSPSAYATVGANAVAVHSDKQGIALAAAEAELEAKNNRRVASLRV